MKTNNESFYGRGVLDWLREVCIVETENEVYYDAESSEKNTVEMFIKNLKAQNVEEENKLLEKLSFKSAKDFIVYLKEDRDGMHLAQKMVAAAYCTRKGIAIDDNTDLYVKEQLYYLNDSRDLHYEYAIDIDLG